MTQLVGKTILITEDNWIILHALQAILADAGAHVVMAANCEDAMSIVEADRVHAALLDYQLGNSDCTELCAALQARRIPFVMLSGYPTEDRVEGASAHLSKPCPENVLLQTVVAVLKAQMPSPKGNGSSTGV